MSTNQRVFIERLLKAIKRWKDMKGYERILKDGKKDGRKDDGRGY